MVIDHKCTVPKAKGEKKMINVSVKLKRVFSNKFYFAPE